MIGDCCDEQMTSFKRIFAVLLSIALWNSVLLIADHVGLRECLSISTVSPAELIDCVNRTNSQTSLSQPICILTRITPEVYSYGAYAYFLQSVYAIHQGYRMLPLVEDSSRPDYAYHRKLVPILDALQSTGCELVVWMDADVIPLSLSLDLLAVAAQHPQADLIASEDVSTMINTGCMLLRRSPWAVSFLQTWLACRDRPGALNDQLGFHCAHAQYDADHFSKHVAILPAYMLNSEAPAMGKQLEHHQILHLAAEDNELREAVFKEVAATVAATVSSYGFPLDDHLLPPQLGMTRQRLQMISIDIYQRLHLAAHDQLTAHLDALKQRGGSHAFPVEAMGQYRAAVSKYCHAVTYLLVDRVQMPSPSRGEDEETAMNLLETRDQAFQMVKAITAAHIASLLLSIGVEAAGDFEDGDIFAQHNAWLDNYVHISRHGFDTASGLRQAYGGMPEALKLTAELGYELLGVYVDYLRQERVQVVGNGTVVVLVKEVAAVLALLMRIVHPNQRSLVQHMVDDFNQFTSTL